MPSYIQKKKKGMTGVSNYSLPGDTSLGSPWPATPVLLSRSQGIITVTPFVPNDKGSRALETAAI